MDRIRFYLTKRRSLKGPCILKRDGKEKENVCNMLIDLNTNTDD